MARHNGMNHRVMPLGRKPPEDPEQAIHHNSPTAENPFGHRSVPWREYLANRKYFRIEMRCDALVQSVSSLYSSFIGVCLNSIE
jgi:hypothetical protein